MENKIEKPKRSLFGKIVKYTFIGFNILMLVWFIGGMSSASKGIENATTEAEQAGAAIGTGLGAMFIIFHLDSRSSYSWDNGIPYQSQNKIIFIISKVSNIAHFFVFLKKGKKAFEKTSFIH